MTNKYNRSPLFYVGDKYKLLPEILPFFPKEINKFIEPFVGGGSVFLNVKAREYHLNDINDYVIKLHKYLNKYNTTPEKFLKSVEKRIIKYGLSRSFLEDIVPKEFKLLHKKTYYAKFNKDAFQKAKQDFNNNKNDIELFYILLIYGFNRMIRFNKKGEYNLPIGNVDFNTNVKIALNAYFENTAKQDLNFNTKDYIDFINEVTWEENDFLYVDPPYLITFSEYNKLWNETNEKQLLDLLDQLNNRGVKFAISNVILYKDKENTLFKQWAEKYNINVVKVIILVTMIIQLKTLKKY